MNYTHARIMHFTEVDTKLNLQAIVIEFEPH